MARGANLSGLAGDVEDALLASIAAVDGASLVRRWVQQNGLQGPIEVLAIGKAAAQMVWGLQEARVEFAGLGVVPKSTKVPSLPGFTWLAGDHPLPGDNSIDAARQVLQWASKPRGNVIVLVSGGASSLCDAPADRVEAWQEAHSAALRVDITTANNGRREESLLRRNQKLAKLLLANSKSVRALVIQDTPELSSVGSGVVWHPEIAHHCLATNNDATAAAGLRLGAAGWSVYAHGTTIQGDGQKAVAEFVAAGEALPAGSALVAGGEAVIDLPPATPPGGRVMHCALLAANILQELATDSIIGMIATDGEDGSTGEAGAIVTAAHASSEAAQNFAAFQHLQAAGATMKTGPMGTNVNDVWVYLRPA